MSQPFCHLHVHTSYSLLDGAAKINQLVEQAVALEQPALAITDHGVMYGIVEFQKACKAAGVKPILGCETYINPTGSRKEKTPGDPINHLVLLAENNVGYSNLCKLISASHLEGFYYKPRVDKELLAEHSEGIIGLSACLKGEITQHLAQDKLDRAEKAANAYKEIFGKDNFFLEIQDHGIAEQRRANTLTKTLCERTGLRAVATNDVHYLIKAHAEAHEMLLCLQTGTVWSDPKRMRYSSNEFYLKSRAEMERLFPDAMDALDITNEIAQRCTAEVEFGKLHFPTFQVPGGYTQREYLTEVACNRLKELYAIKDWRKPCSPREKEIMDRFYHELDIIEKTGFINYFLVVRDFVQFAHRNNIPVGPGRGSGGGSIVAYACGIISIDPLRYNLIFERFLNPERVSPPDFDIDFCQSRRGEVIEYVKEKYGADHVAQIITFGSLGAKTVVRDVGRALEIPFSRCAEITKKIPDDPKMTLKKAQEDNPEFRLACENDDDLRRILKYAYVLEGLYRNPGIHAAGVVIGEKPLIDIIPLARGKDEGPITQFAKEPVEKVGLLKMDFLGLKTLTVVKEAVDLIEQNHGISIIPDDLPLDDQPTYELLSRADTIGVFQVESSGMRRLIRDIGINNIEDLIAVIALFRPGPMDMLPDYIARKTGKTDLEYDHPALEPILRDTYGVMVYQEQVQKAANVLAGYSLGQADILRRAMGKKKAEVMEKQKDNFIKGCIETQDMPPKQAEAIFDNIAQFAEYGFNKAHSAGYGIVSYQTAYLKANYPAEFMSALISSEIGNFDKMPGFIAEADNMNLPIKMPDVNHSGVRFTPEANGIRYGLAGVKGVGGKASETIVREREANGPYESLVDFCTRVSVAEVNKKSIESLVRSGAMDCFGTHRARMFNGIDLAMSRAAEQARDRASGQGSLFDLMEQEDAAAHTEALQDCELWPQLQMLAAERELLGVYMTGHPLELFKDMAEQYQLQSIEQVPEYQDGKDVRLVGIVTDISKKISKRDKRPWAIITIEDKEHSTEAMVYSDTYAKYGDRILAEAPMVICGEVQIKESETRLVIYELYPLEDAPKHFASRVGIHLNVETINTKALQQIHNILRLHPGNVPTLLALNYPDGKRVLVEADSNFHVLPDQAFIDEIEALPGKACVVVSVNRKPYAEGGKPKRRRFKRHSPSAA